MLFDLRSSSIQILVSILVSNFFSLVIISTENHRNVTWVNVHYPKTHSKFLLDIHAFTQPVKKLLSFRQPEVQCML
jgi:hypothetical protein